LLRRVVLQKFIYTSEVFAASISIELKERMTKEERSCRGTLQVGLGGNINWIPELRQGFPVLVLEKE
jgi:hypothetical protein